MNFVNLMNEKKIKLYVNIAISLLLIMHVQVLMLSLNVNGTAKDAPKNLKLDSLRMIRKEKLLKELVSFLIYLRKESKSRKKFHQLLLLTKMLNHLIITT